jgi:hypothetical protein
MSVKYHTQDFSELRGNISVKTSECQGRAAAPVGLLKAVANEYRRLILGPLAVGVLWVSGIREGVALS